MFERFQQWRTRRKIKQTIENVENQHQAIIAKGWPLTAHTVPAERARIAAEAVAWLASQLPYAATPHGLSRYRIGVAYAHMDGDQRTFLSQERLPSFDRINAAAMFAQVETLIATRDLAAWPTLTTLEVYMLSYGNLLKPLYDAE